MEGLAKLLVDYGPWGVVVIAFGAIGVLWKAYARVQESRVQDAKAAAKEQTEALIATASSLEANTRVLEAYNRKED